MERSSFAILFFIRDSRVKKDGTVYIEVVLSVNGERCSFSTGKKVKATSWDKTRQLVKGKDDEAKSLNNFLKAVRSKLYEKEAELMDKGFVVTAELLRDAYFDKVDALKDKTLLQVLTEHNSLQKAMVGKTVAPATYWSFEYSERLFKEYIQKNYGRKDLYLREKTLV